MLRYRYNAVSERWCKDQKRKISEEFTRQTERVTGRSIRILIGLINRSIRPMVFSFRRSKCRSNWTRVTFEVILVDNDFHLCFFFHAFLRSTRGLAASIGLHEFLSSVVPRIKFHRCINNRGADERHTESVETSFGLIRSDDTVPRCVLVSFTR